MSHHITYNPGRSAEDARWKCERCGRSDNHLAALNKQPCTDHAQEPQEKQCQPTD